MTRLLGQRPLQGEFVNCGHARDRDSRACHRASSDSKALEQRMPSSSACSVNTCNGSAFVAALLPRCETPRPQWSIHRCRRGQATHRRSAASSAVAGRSSRPPASIGQNGARAAGVAGVSQAIFPLELQAVGVDLPTRGGMRLRRERRTPARRRSKPRSNSRRVQAASASRDAVLPAHVIVAVQADLEARDRARCASPRRPAGQYPGPAAARRTAASSSRSA